VIDCSVRARDAHYRVGMLVGHTQLETEEYRGYRLIASRSFLRWHVTAEPSRDDLALLRLVRKHLGLERALAYARRRVDAALGAASLYCARLD
jgi:hypothetical protein